MKRTKIIALTLFGMIFLWSNALFGQVRPNLGNTSRLLNNAIQAMDDKDYDKANQFFREIIDSQVPIPQEMPYYFAETLFQLQQYDNSANFVGKYLEINGTKGAKYQEAKDLEKRLEEPLNAIRSCQLCDRRGYRFKTCFTCEGEKETEQDCNYCKAKGIIGCSRCAGSGMVTKKNVFNIVEYFECERCSGKGRLTCPTCEGTKLEKGSCRTCMGAGRLNSEIICEHDEEGEAHEEGIVKPLDQQSSSLNFGQGPLFHYHPVHSH